jgi:hypothetical protein
MTRIFFLQITLLLCFLTGFSVKILGQTKNKKEELSLIDPSITISNFYTIDELNTMGKAELIKLYKERFKVIINLLPYNALTSRPGVTLEELGIPQTSENKDLVVEEEKNREVFYRSFDASLNNFIAYADKSNIVWSILFFEDTIKRVSLGKDY